MSLLSDFQLVVSIESALLEEGDIDVDKVDILDDVQLGIKRFK